MTAAGRSRGFELDEYISRALASRLLFRSLRPCPRCGGYLLTAGTGRFVCEVCDYSDRQNVDRLLAAGLDYDSPNNWGPSHWRGP